MARPVAAVVVPHTNGMKASCEGIHGLVGGLNLHRPIAPYITHNAMKYGSISHHLQLRGQDYRALFAAAVKRNNRVDNQACTVSVDQEITNNNQPPGS